MAKKVEAIIEDVIQVEGGNKPNGGYTNDPKDPGGETKYGITAKVWRKHGYRGAIKDAPRDLAVKIYMEDYVITPKFDKVNELSSLLGSEVVDSGVNLGVTWPARWLIQAMNVMVAPNSGIMRLRSFDNFQQILDVTRARKNKQVTIFLQRCLNALNNGKWPNIDPDGIHGKNTESSIASFTKQRGTQGGVVITRMVNALCLDSLLGTNIPEKYTVRTSLTNDNIAALKSILSTDPNAEEEINILLNTFQCVRYITLTEARETNETYLYGWVNNRVEI